MHYALVHPPESLAEPGHPAPTGTRVRRRTGPDLLPAHPLIRRRRPHVSGCVDGSQDPPLRLGITPGIRLESPALDRPHQRCHVDSDELPVNTIIVSTWAR